MRMCGDGDVLERIQPSARFRRRASRSLRLSDPNRIQCPFFWPIPVGAPFRPINRTRLPTRTLFHSMTPSRDSPPNKRSHRRAQSVLPSPPSGPGVSPPFHLCSTLLRRFEQPCAGRPSCSRTVPIVRSSHSLHTQFLLSQTPDRPHTTTLMLSIISVPRGSSPPAGHAHKRQ